MSDRKPDADIQAPAQDDKLLDDLAVDEESDVSGGRRIGKRMSPES